MPKAGFEYIAGIIDGEGSISIYHQKKILGKVHSTYNVRIVVGMTDDRVIKELQNQYGGSIWSEKRRDGWKECSIWYLTGKKVEQFLKDILPYLIIKREQAILALKLRDHINQRKIVKKGYKGLLPINTEEIKYRESMKEKMHNLNRRGVAIYAESIGNQT